MLFWFKNIILFQKQAHSKNLCHKSYLFLRLMLLMLKSVLTDFAGSQISLKHTRRLTDIEGCHGISWGFNRDCD